MNTPMTLNRRVLRIFFSILLITGALGFRTPSGYRLMSGAAPYNIFHILFGLAGVGLSFWGSEGTVRAYNFTFGLIDLYQALASFLHLFPERYFLWTRADDMLHILIGTGLVAVALWRRSP